MITFKGVKLESPPVPSTALLEGMGEVRREMSNTGHGFCPTEMSTDVGDTQPRDQ